ncbi:MAG TPA: hypothetical protein VIR16_12920, partial [Candidatus Limnocylindrales bacterium]
MTWDRRGLLLGAGALLVAGCTRPSAASTTASTPGSPPVTSPASTASSDAASVPATPAASPTTAAGAAGLPAVTPWSADPNELQGAVKLVATRMLETLGTWDASTA